MSNLKQALSLNDDESPFPWQEELLAKFRAGIGNRMSLDIPTGLGKTSVMAAWQVVRARAASGPRRRLYVVDRCLLWIGDSGKSRGENETDIGPCSAEGSYR